MAVAGDDDFGRGIEARDAVRQRCGATVDAKDLGGAVAIDHHRVGVCATVDEIATVSRVPEDLVVAGVAIDRIVACASDDEIVAAIAVESIVPGIA